MFPLFGLIQVLELLQIPFEQLDLVVELLDDLVLEPLELVGMLLLLLGMVSSLLHDQLN